MKTVGGLNPTTLVFRNQAVSAPSGRGEGEELLQSLVFFLLMKTLRWS
jgi:hypothetical protein